MAELFDHIDELRRSPGKVAVATLVNTRGTTPRKEGAKMLVGEGGSVLGSVTIGGCVDAQVIEQSEDVLTTMRPRLLELNLGDEEAWEIGLTCGGTIEVFVEPMEGEFLERVRAHTGRGGRAAIVTRLDGPIGAKLLVLDAAAVVGTLGDRALDESFTREAQAAIAAGSSRTLLLDNVRAFVEVFAPPALLLIVGANHVAMPLTALAKVLGYRTVVLDGRPRFATKERFPDVVAEDAPHERLDARRVTSLSDRFHGVGAREPGSDRGWPETEASWLRFRALIGRQLPPPRAAWISAMTASAISGAERAPMSRPIGTRMRVSDASLSPSSARSFRMAAPRRADPSIPM